MKSENTLIVPYWTSAPWWPLLVTHEGCFQREIADYMIIVPRENLFIPSVPGLSMFSSNIPSFNLLALRFCFCILGKCHMVTFHSKFQASPFYSHSGSQLKLEFFLKCELNARGNPMYEAQENVLLHLQPQFRLYICQNTTLQNVKYSKPQCQNLKFYWYFLHNVVNIFRGWWQVPV